MLDVSNTHMQILTSYVSFTMLSFFSVLAYSASTWYGTCSVQLCDDIKKFHNRALRLITLVDQFSLNNNNTVCKDRCIDLANKIMQDGNHPGEETQCHLWDKMW